MLKKIYNNLEEIIGSILFVVMLIVLMAQTLSHQGFGTPLMWSEQLGKLLFIYAGYIGVVASIKDNSHVSIDIIFTRLPKNVRKWVERFNQLIVLAELVTVFIISIPIVRNQAHLTLVSLYNTMVYLSMALPILTLLMIYRMIERIIKEWRKDSRTTSEVEQMDILVIFIVWGLLLALGIPVGFTLIIAALMYFLTGEWNLTIASGGQLISGINNFTLLAIPFFIMTGNLMNSSGITDRIFNFASSLVGHVPGGVGHVNITASLMFSGMSGSSLADAGGLGQLEIRSMRKAGYDDDFNGGLTAASSILSGIIPPSLN